MDSRLNAQDRGRKRPLHFLAFFMALAVVLCLSGCSLFLGIFYGKTKASIAYDNATVTAAKDATAAESLRDISIFQRKILAVYLTEGVDNTGVNIGNTPAIYLNPQCKGDISHSDIELSPGITNVVDQYFDFALPTEEVNAAINAQRLDIPSGIYAGIRIEYNKGKNSATAHDMVWGSGSFQEETLGQPCVETVMFASPITVIAPQSVLVTLSYSLNGCLTLKQPGEYCPWGCTIDGQYWHFLPPRILPSAILVDGS